MDGPRRDRPPPMTRVRELAGETQWRLGSESKSLYKLLSAQHLLIPADLAYPEYVPRYVQ